MRLLKRLVPVAVLLVVVLGLATYSRYHRVLPKVAQKLAAAAPQTQTVPQAAQVDAANANGTQDSGQGVTVVGPLADYALHDSSSQPASGTSAEPASPAPSNGVTPMDRVFATPPGPGGEILPARFSMTRMASFSFEVPPHAYSPRLAGAYRANSAEGSPAGVDMLVLTADQYAALAGGSPGEALFSAEASTGQNLDLVLPVSHDDPVRYFVVFRGDAKTRKIVSSTLRLEP